MTENVIIGRSRTCQVIVNDETVSRLHSQIISNENGTIINDLDSKGGTHVNGLSRKSYRLKGGDAIRLGNSYFLYSSGVIKPINRKSYLNRVQRHIFQRYALPVIAAVLAILLIVHDKEDKHSEDNLFNAPKDLESFITTTREKVYSISCENSNGTAWPLQLAEQTVLITNVHVIKECIVSAVPVYVENSIGRKQVRVLRSDENADIAVLEDPFDVQGFSIQQSVSIGTWVMAIGNPLGLDRSVNFGKISNVEKRQIIFDTAINPGNSGGPLLNSSGEVIAIVTAIVSEAQGMAVGTPIRGICDSLIACSNGGLRLG